MAQFNPRSVRFLGNKFKEAIEVYGPKGKPLHLKDYQKGIVRKELIKACIGNPLDLDNPQNHDLKRSVEELEMMEFLIRDRAFDDPDIIEDLDDFMGELRRLYLLFFNEVEKFKGKNSTQAKPQPERKQRGPKRDPAFLQDAMVLLDDCKRFCEVNKGLTVQHFLNDRGLSWDYYQSCYNCVYHYKKTLLKKKK